MKDKTLTFQLTDQLIFKHLKRIKKTIPGVQEGDVESLHQLRVNVRRLRNALWIFKGFLPCKHMKAWDKNMRRIAGVTSAGRDLDVFIIFLESFRTKIKNQEQLKLLDDVMALLSERRIHLQPSINTAVSRKKTKRVWRDIQNYSKNEMKTRHETDIYKFGYKKIKKRVVDLLEFDRIVRYPEKVKDLHEMRIAAKHLRYTLEGLSLLYDEQLDVSIATVLTFHRQLGAIHDYEIWMQEIAQLEKTPPLREKAAQSLWDSLKSHLQMQKEAVHIQFFEGWQQAKENRAFENMCEYAYAWCIGLQR